MVVTGAVDLLQYYGSIRIWKRSLAYAGVSMLRWVTLLVVDVNVTLAQMFLVVVAGMGRIGLVHLEAITKAPGVKAVIVSNPTISKAEVRRAR